VAVQIQSIFLRLSPHHDHREKGEGSHVEPRGPVSSRCFRGMKIGRR
jgi:hypothetical protein